METDAQRDFLDDSKETEKFFKSLAYYNYYYIISILCICTFLFVDRSAVMESCSFLKGVRILCYVVNV